MATVQEHYDSHLGKFYSWMMGDWASKQAEFHKFLTEHALLPHITRKAIDLGAGHGIQHNQVVNRVIAIIACKM